MPLPGRVSSRQREFSQKQLNLYRRLEPTLWEQADAAAGKKMPRMRVIVASALLQDSRTE
jgi:hypothetical protein